MGRKGESDGEGENPRMCFMGREGENDGEG